MAKYLYRTCPKCKDYLGVVVPEPPEPVTEVPIDARCLRCGFKLAWKVIKGKKLPGQYGGKRHTETGLQVVRVDAERNLLFVRGAVPGPKTGVVTVSKQGGRGRYA